MMTQSQVDLAVRLSEILGWSKIRSQIMLPALEPLILQLERFGITNSAINLKPDNIWIRLAGCKQNGHFPTPQKQRIIFAYRRTIESKMIEGKSFVDACQEVFQDVLNK